MATIYRYEASGDACPHCADWDGVEDENEANLPPAPNPDCYRAYACRCRITTRDTETGCYCYEGCPQEYWDDECDCPDPDGCCCYDAEGEPWWSSDCDCTGGGGGGGGGGVNGCFDDEGNDTCGILWGEDWVCCEQANGNSICLPLELCY